MTHSDYGVAGTDNETRGIFGGGCCDYTNIIDYITIDTTGNATDFGDLTVSRYNPGATSNNTRAVFCGGGDGTDAKTTMDYITIASTGNATDFGDMVTPNSEVTGTSGD